MSGVPLAEFAILLVEDEPHQARIVSAMLEKVGFRRIAISHDGADGISTARNTGCDLVIADIVMSPVSGLDLLKSVRMGAAGIAPDTPVVLITAQPDSRVIDEAKEFRANAFLVKPFNIRQLSERLVPALRGRQPIETERRVQPKPLRPRLNLTP